MGRSLVILIVGWTVLTAQALAQYRIGFVRNHGGAGNEEARDVDELPNGDLLVAGWTTSFGHGSNDLYLTKWSSGGDLLWTQTYGGTGQDGYEWVGLQVTSDGGSVLCGESNSSPALSRDFYVVRTDGDGNVLWQRDYGGADEERPRDLRQTRDGGFIIVGFTRSYGQGPASYYVVKTDPNGNVAWDGSYGGYAIDDAHSVDVLKDGGYVVAGYTTSFGSGPADIYVVRLDEDGEIVWEHTYGGAGSEGVAEYVRIREIADGGFGIASFTTSSGHGGKDAYFVKTDPAGNVLWTRTYGGTGNDDARDFVPLPEGGFALVGYTYSWGQSGDLFLIVTNSSGQQRWRRHIGGAGQQIGYSLEPTNDGGLVAVGSTITNGNSNFYIVKLDAVPPEHRNVMDDEVLAAPKDSPLPNDFRVTEGYPNPFNSEINFDYQVPEAGAVEITVHNALGQVAYHTQKSAAPGTQRFIYGAAKGELLTTGVQFVEFRYGSERVTRKVLYLK